MKSFKLRDPESTKYYTVEVYDNLKDLRKAAHRHDKQCGSEYNPTHDQIAGICHMFERYKILPDGKEVISDQIGIIRYAKTHLHNEIIAHELVHAALYQYRLEYGTDHDFEGSVRNACFGMGCGETEEIFCHIYGRLFRQLVHQLYKHKLWTE